MSKSIRLVMLCVISITMFMGSLGVGNYIPEIGNSQVAYANNTCVPYGPTAGRQYSPRKLMQLINNPENPNVGPFLSAHRGAWGNNIPENSIMAIDKAAELKVEMIELDVKSTLDNKIVLMHDYTVGRTTNYQGSGVNDGYWDPFYGVTPLYESPQDTGDWTEHDKYNIAVNKLTLAQLTDLTLRPYNANNEELGERFDGIATGTIVNGSAMYGKVPSLLESLTHIGNNYPGMTVALDIRHLSEVTGSMDVIDQVTDCLGVPAREWVIIKPFANIFPGGWKNAQTLGGSTQPNSVMGIYGERATKYKWIPAFQSRFFPPNAAGVPSVIPGTGLDTAQLSLPALNHVKDWLGGGVQKNYRDIRNVNVITAELDYGDTTLDPKYNVLTDAYNWMETRTTNVLFWRWVDIELKDKQYVPADPAAAWKKIDLGNNTYRLESADDFDSLLQDPSTNPKSRVKMVQGETHQGNATKWTSIVTGDHIRIKNVFSNHWLQRRADNTIYTAPTSATGDATKWKLVNVQDTDYFRIVNKQNNYWLYWDWNNEVIAVNPTTLVGNKTLIGFTWKDDGTGARATYLQNSRTWQQVKNYAGLLTVDDITGIIGLESNTRVATQNAISHNIMPGILPGQGTTTTDHEYTFFNINSLENYTYSADIQLTGNNSLAALVFDYKESGVYGQLEIGTNEVDFVRWNETYQELEEITIGLGTNKHNFQIEQIDHVTSVYLDGILLLDYNSDHNPLQVKVGYNTYGWGPHINVVFPTNVSVQQHPTGY